MICKYNTHTNIRTKKKPKIKYSSNLQKKNKVSTGDKSNYKYSILLEDFINKKKNNSKNKYETSKASSIKNYLNLNQLNTIKKCIRHKHNSQDLSSHFNKNNVNDKQLKYCSSLTNNFDNTIKKENANSKIVLTTNSIIKTNRDLSNIKKQKI